MINIYPQTCACQPFLGFNISQYIAISHSTRCPSVSDLSPTNQINRPASDFEPDNNLRQNSGQRVVFFFSRATPRSTWFCKWRKSASNLDKKWDREGGGLCVKFLLAAANLGAQWPLFGCTRRRVRAADNISPTAAEKRTSLHSLIELGQTIYFSDRSLLKFSHCFLKINYL